MYHSMYELPGLALPYNCSCGEWFHNAVAALDHALPLNTRELADVVAADPKSSPELIARAEKLAQDASHD